MWLRPDTSLTLPTPGGDGVEEVFHLYVVQHPERDRLRAFLGERGVQTGIHYPRPIHLQTRLRRPRPRTWRVPHRRASQRHRALAADVRRTD